VGRLHGRQLLHLHDVEICSPTRTVVMLEPCVWAHTPVGTGLVVRGEDLLCEAETRRARRRLVVRGGDSSCEAETCRGGSSNGKQVGDAAN
jgi:hypothetical protein